MATLDQKEKEIKDVSKGENPIEALKEGSLDALPEHYEDRSPILIEPIEKIKIGSETEPKIIHLAASLSDEERKEFIKNFKEKQINFAWSYDDMPGLDPKLIMHHLNIKGVKPVK